MLKQLVVSCVTVAALGVGLASAVTGAEAHHFSDYPRSGFGLFFSPPGVFDNGYCGDGYYNNGYYDNSYCEGFHHVRRHASYRCHIGSIRFHHRLHDARICNGRVTKIY